MKKNLRVSDDYVAVDFVDTHGVITDTPIYLSLNKPKEYLWNDGEKEKYVAAIITYTSNGNLKCVDREGFEWESDVSELLTECRPFSDQVRPGDSD